MAEYDFDVFAKSGIDPVPDAVIYGIGSGILSYSAASELEEWMIENRHIEGSPDVLAADNASEALDALHNAGYEDAGSGCDILRYAILASLEEDDPELFSKIEGVYADFGYPKDMEQCIYYMPVSEGDSTPEGLSKRFADFLDSEKSRLGL
ncbi:MAG: DUF2247 family protein [Coriobacteriales bacterium]|jgi:hypothetical protein